MRLLREDVLPLAHELVELLSPHAERIEIAGSLRREKATVKDIELVVAPRFQTNLFGEVNLDAPSHVDVEMDKLLAAGTIAKRTREDGQNIGWGMKFKAGVYRGVALDLFAVRPPAQWGAVFAIRTGPGDFSKHLVTACQKRGVRCVQGALHRADGSIVDTPSEEDFFKECGVAWKPPRDR